MAADYRELVAALTAIIRASRDYTCDSEVRVQEMAKLARMALNSLVVVNADAEEQDEIRISTLWQERNSALRDAVLVRKEVEPLLEDAQQARMTLEMPWQEARSYGWPVSKTCREKINAVLNAASATPPKGGL